jgi:hypothetical protein
VFDEEHEQLDQTANESNLHTLGGIGGHNVVIICLPAGQLGNNFATAVTIQIKLKARSEHLDNPGCFLEAFGLK